jgi:hypothetical protein
MFSAFFQTRGSLGDVPLSPKKTISSCAHSTERQIGTAKVPIYRISSILRRASHFNISEIGVPRTFGGFEESVPKNYIV